MRPPQPPATSTPIHPVPPRPLVPRPPKALRDREEAVSNGKLATIVFIRDANARGQEVSGYIDYGARLASDGGAGMEPVFARRRRLMPRPTDLSFYNWRTHLATSNPTANFQVGPAGGGGRARPGCHQRARRRRRPPAPPPALARPHSPAARQALQPRLLGTPHPTHAPPAHSRGPAAGPPQR
jgi:hypothetical protein